MDPLDELQTLHEKKRELEETIRKVSSFPEKVTRPCLVPISRVAYLPGHFIHTNEFVVDIPEPNEGDDSGVVDLQDLTWTSHTETAAILQERVTKIAKRIRTIENASISKNGLTVLKEIDWPSKSTAAAEVATSKSTAAARPESILEPESTLPFYEIREFEDENGRMTGHEILEMSKLMEQHGAKPENTDAAPKTSGENTFDEKTAKALEALGKRFEEASLKQQQSADPEVAFAAELLRTQAHEPSSSPGSAGDLDFLDALASKENSSECKESTKALHQVKAKKQNPRSSSKPSNGVWKKGFLVASQDEEDKEKEKTSAGDAGVAALPVSTPAPKPASASPFGGPIIEKNI